MWGNHQLALKTWKFLTATLKCIYKDFFYLSPHTWRHYASWPLRPVEAIQQIVCHNEINHVCIPLGINMKTTIENTTLVHTQSLPWCNWLVISGDWSWCQWVLHIQNVCNDRNPSYDTPTADTHHQYWKWMLLLRFWYIRRPLLHIMNTFHAPNCTQTIHNDPNLMDTHQPFQQDCP